MSPAHGVFSLEAGWPGVGLGVLRGLSDHADVGLKLQLLYGFEETTGQRLGAGLAVPLRLVAFREGAGSLLLQIEPGLPGYWTGGRERFSAQLTVGYRSSAGSEEQPGFFWSERNRSLFLVGSGALVALGGASQ